MFLVISYNSMNIGTAAHVVINGLYTTEEEARQRQFHICGEYMAPVFEGSVCMLGVNGVISWIKEIPLGDTDRFDIKQPR